MKCGHDEDYIMGCGDNLYCGVCKIERLTTKGEIMREALDEISFKWDAGVSARSPEDSAFMDCAGIAQEALARVSDKQR